MALKTNHVVIPLITIATISLGSLVTSLGMNWYSTIKLPAFTPPGSFIGAVWTVLFILATLSALIVWNKAWRKRKNIIGIAFVLNILLNVGWSVLFFGLHLIGPAIYESALLGVSVLVLIILIWPVSKLAVWLLVPYMVWVSFATFLTYTIWSLNK
ncbi:MAG: tryptophan-rich sensory protein [Candidatus Magasanikbacteria bacterium]|nr:tryptophan-rich sensory protein [Candidatus Magasanikbacteria bacterium]